MHVEMLLCTGGKTQQTSECISPRGGGGRIPLPKNLTGLTDESEKDVA